MDEFAPRFVQAKAMRFVGLRRHYTGEDMGEVPAHWMEFIGHDVPGKLADVAYGLVFDRPDGVDYMPAWEVAAADPLPAGFAATEMPAGRYAVFRHDDHVSKISGTVDRIWRQWVPSARNKPIKRPGAAYFFERYGEKFDPRKGEGDIEIWIPIEA